MTVSEAKEMVEECGLNIEEPTHEEVLNIVVASLEKQIPKRWEDERIVWNKFDEIDHWEGFCPNCKTKIVYSEERKCCECCGQALDWSETE